jgi:hypothetical protein
MVIKQISVFVENRPGTLAEVLGVLKEHDINIRALSVADTADFGILRIIVSEPEKVERVLRGANFTVKLTPVITMTIGDSPGGLLEQVEKLSASGINVEYVYAFAAMKGTEARVVLKVDDPDRAIRLIQGEASTGVRIETGEGPQLYW